MTCAQLYSHNYISQDIRCNNILGHSFTTIESRDTTEVSKAVYNRL